MAYDKLVLVDFETTGLDAQKDEIIEIGAILCDAQSLEVIWEYEQKLLPTHIETAHPKALEVNGYTPELWKDALPFEDGFADFLVRLDHTMIFTGQNVWFDLQFYLETLRKLGFIDLLDPTPYGYSYHRLDITSMAYPFLNPPVYRMSHIAPALGIAEEEKPHHAINGVRKELQILKEIKRRGAEWRFVNQNSRGLFEWPAEYQFEGK
jgi:DNA polymerase III epsilon subunit-like protein